MPTFRIRRHWIDLIIAGEKVVEYRRTSPWWDKVAPKSIGKEAVFVCGKLVVRRPILDVRLVRTPGDLDYGAVDTPWCWAFEIGRKVK